ncbi:glycosyltransferase family 2 protein [Rhodopila globiformis]|uniref:glycosyltransferase family 2 protein n=1 Tax=Rhodopila globiformis TaxID=1071 RepID=UPI0011B02536|nr:glycosyltransferase family 2 protein [Rhodopila globiformis]
MPDITATVVFHNEGAFAIPALESFRFMVGAARRHGIKIQTQAVLDRPDYTTRHVVNTFSDWLDNVEEVNFGDLGLSRNAAVERANGRFLAFFDGDDLWGAEWLCRAYALAQASDAPEKIIWHPAWLYYFSEADFDRTVLDATAHPDAASFLATHEASTSDSFDGRGLVLDNVWTANVFAAKELHMRFPYPATDAQRGVGVEDWSWNLATLAARIAHLIVPETVHLIRIKESNSVGQRNIAKGLLPNVPANFLWAKQNELALR